MWLNNRKIRHQRKLKSKAEIKEVVMFLLTEVKGPFMNDPISYTVPLGNNTPTAKGGMHGVVTAHKVEEGS